MRFHEHARHARGDRGTREHGHELALPARRRALPAGQLHRMRGIEHDRAIRAAQHGECTHVRDQIVIAEAEAPLADHHLRIAGGAGLVDHILHFPGREKLTLLDVHRLALRGRGHDEVRLPAEKRRRLQHIDDRSHFGQGRVLVHVGEHGHGETAADVRQHLESGLETRTAETRARGAVRLVERGLEHVGHAQATGDLQHPPGDLLAQGGTFDHAGPCDQEQRLACTDLEFSEFHDDLARRR